MADRDILSDPAVAKVLTAMAAQAPAFAGAVLSLAFVGRLTSTGRIVAVLTGLLSAVFLGPFFAAFLDLFWPGDMPPEARTGIIFMTGLSAVGAIPAMLETIKRMAGDPWGVIERWMPARLPEPPPSAPTPPANDEVTDREGGA